MGVYKNLNLKNKKKHLLPMIIPFVVILLVTIVFSIIAHNYQVNLEKNSKHHSKLISLMIRTKFLVLSLGDYQNAYTVDCIYESANCTTENNANRKKFLETKKSLEEHLVIVRENIGSNEKGIEKLNEIEKSVNLFFDGDKKVVSLFRTGDPQKIKQASKFVFTEELIIDQNIINSIDDLAKLVIGELLAETRTTINQFLILRIGIIVLALLGLIVAFYLLYKLFTGLQRENVLENQVYESQKMEAIGRLAGGIAHDFNNFLTIIIGYTDIALSKSEKEVVDPKSLERIKKAGVEASELTKKLLAFSKSKMEAKDDLSLNCMVREMKETFDTLIGEHIKIETNLYDDMLLFKGDPVQIQQVLINLMINARDAMTNGGTLIITTKPIQFSDDLEKSHIDLGASNYVMLSIEDTGIGMDDNTKSKIFEPFFSTKGEKGTGLGLSTVYGIVKNHKGVVSCHSEVGVGTRFHIYLPRISSKKDTKMIHDDAKCKITETGENILLVEDNPNVRDFVFKSLSNQGYKITTAQDGVEALDVLNQRTKNFDLLITDVMMPNMGGRELAEQVKKINPNMNILFISGYTDGTFENFEFNGNNQQFLQKPFTLETLCKAVDACL